MSTATTQRGHNEVTILARFLDNEDGLLPRDVAELHPRSGDVRRPAQEGVERPEGFVPPGDDQRKPVLEVAASRPCRVGHVVQVHLVQGAGQEIAERAAQVV